MHYHTGNEISANLCLDDICLEKNWHLWITSCGMISKNVHCWFSVQRNSEQNCISNMANHSASFTMSHRYWFWPYKSFVSWPRNKRTSRMVWLISWIKLIVRSMVCVNWEYDLLFLRARNSVTPGLETRLDDALVRSRSVLSIWLDMNTDNDRVRTRILKYRKQ